MTITRNQITTGKFNEAAKLPYELRLEDFKLAIQDVYDFFFDVNSHLVEKGLDRLDEMLTARRRVAERYTAFLSNHPCLEPPFVPPHVTPNWQSYQIRVRAGGKFDRNSLMEALHAAGIATRRGVMASHLEPPYRAMDARLPATEAAAAECLQLPIHAGMGEAETEQVLAVLEQTCKRESR